MALNPLASPFDTQEGDVFSSSVGMSVPQQIEPVSAMPYYGVTDEQRAILNRQATENLSQLPTNEAGLVDLSSAYQDYSNKLASGDLSFLEDLSFS